MEFINQIQAKNMASILSKDIKGGYKHNIIIRGNSGCGKTTLAKLIAKESNKNFILISGRQNILSGYSMIIIDEAHLMKNPETVYDLMDSSYCSVIILTTELGELPEPLLNRCVLIELVEYTLIDLQKIARIYGKDLPLSITNEIANRCRGVPRNIQIMCEVLLASKRNGLSLNVDSTGYYTNGYTKLDYSYLNYLQKAGSASLKTISRYLGVSTNVLENVVEPFLIKRDKIYIDSKGRHCVN